MELDELSRLISLCKKEGIKKIKTSDVEIYFNDQINDGQKLDPVSLSKVFSEGMPPDGSLLFASSEEMPGIDSAIPEVPSM